MPLSPGDRIAHYVVEEILGQGGGGVVYRARDTKLERLVAIKMMHETSTPAGKDAHARVLREARAAAQLSHPNTVAVFEVGEHEGVAFLAMEYVRGRSLRTLVGDPALSIDHRLRWLADIASALQAAHQSGVVHRDVKPENVIVRDDGVVKVVDFGIARPAPAARPASAGGPGAGPRPAEITASPSVGTPHYMAPEQLKNQAVDPRADQFAWAVVAYELLSGGALPWDSSAGVLRYVAGVLGEDATPLRDRDPDVPMEVATAIHRALSRAADDRFPSMEAAAAAFDPYLNVSSQNVVRHILSVAPPAPGLVNEPTTRAPFSAFVAPTLSGPEVTVESPRALDAPAAPIARPRSRRWPPGPPRGALAALAVLAAVVAAVAVGAIGLFARRRPAAPAATAAIARHPTAITDLPTPPSTSPEARSEYVAALQSLRDGAVTTARVKLTRAALLDPMMAAAHLRLAKLDEQHDARFAHAEYERARELRSMLSERDQRLLGALEPLLARTQADAAETSRRLTELSERYPDDAELAAYLGDAMGMAGDIRGATAAIQRALTIDPEYLQMLGFLGEGLSYLGDFDAALATLARCIDRAGSATQCVYLTNRIQSQRGECRAMADTVMRFLATTPDDAPAVRDLANTMAADGAPAGAVKAVVERTISVSPERTRERTRAQLEADLALAGGDFATAEAAIERLAEVVASEPSLYWHGEVTLRRVEIDEETGRTAEAGAAVKALIEEKDGWTPEPRVEDVGIARDPLPLLWGALRRAGILSADELRSRLDEWTASWRKKAPPFYLGYVWVQAYPATVETKAEAEAALAALPSFGGVPPFRPDTGAPIGRVYLLAGRVDDALGYLRPDAASCAALNRPVEHVRAILRLGHALETEGDMAGACNAYASVLEKWGHARPRSVTADDARRRVQALHCESRRADE